MSSVSAWIGVASLAFTVLIQTALMAFWLGRLSQRVTSVEKAGEGRQDLADKVTRLTVEMEHANAALTKMGREMEGVNRQLGNIAMGRVGHAAELGGKS